MKLSVVIPVYNEEKYIGNCLDSLLKQTEKPDEIIVVDNNSTDKSIDIVKKYPVTIVKETKQGMIPARNTGFSAAKGDIIARCDADVILPADWIKKIKEHFAQHTIAALSGPIEYYDVTIRSTIYADIYFVFMKIILRGKETLVGPNMALSKKIWNSIKYNVCMDDKKVHEDIDLAVHIIKAGGKIKKDESLIVKTSARRIKNNPVSFFIEYPIRLFKTLHAH